MDNRIAWKPQEFADAVGISRAKACELIAAGDVPSIRVGGSVRVPVDGAKSWIARQLDETKKPEQQPLKKGKA